MYDYEYCSHTNSRVHVCYFIINTIRDLLVKRSEDMIQYCSFSGKETFFFHFKFKTDNKVVRLKIYFKQSKNNF